MSNAPFSIKFFRPSDHDTIKATFTAAFGKLELNDCKLVAGREGLFFSPPARKYEKDGATKYANYFYITDEALRGQIEAAAIAELEKQQNSQRGSNQGQQGGFHPDDDVPF